MSLSQHPQQQTQQQQQQPSQEPSPQQQQQQQQYAHSSPNVHIDVVDDIDDNCSEEKRDLITPLQTNHNNNNNNNNDDLDDEQDLDNLGQLPNLNNTSPSLTQQFAQQFTEFNSLAQGHYDELIYNMQEKFSTFSEALDELKKTELKLPLPNLPDHPSASNAFYHSYKRYRAKPTIPLTLLASLIAILWIVLAYFSIIRIPIPLTYLLSTYVLLEIGFYFLYRSRLQSIQRFTTPPPHVDMCNEKGRLRIFAQMLSTLSLEKYNDVGDISLFFQQWFLGTSPVKNKHAIFEALLTHNNGESLPQQPTSTSPIANAITNIQSPDIPRGNMIMWLAWAVFGLYPTQLSMHESAELSNYVNLFQRLCPTLNFKPGVNPHVSSMRLSLSPANDSYHHPLIYYYVVSSLQSVAYLVLHYYLGFEHHTIGDHSYWYRSRGQNLEFNTTGSDEAEVQHASQERSRVPLVFISGVGHGIGYYLNFLSKLVVDSDVYLVELPFVSNKFFDDTSRSSDFWVSTIDVMLQEHNHNKAVFIAHSYGSFVASWCTKYRPHIVHAIFLLDPVALLLCQPTTCYQFMYAPTQNIMDFVRKVISSELTLVSVMRRAFFWSDMSLMLTDIPQIPVKLNTLLQNPQYLKHYQQVHGPNNNHNSNNVIMNSTPKNSNTTPLSTTRINRGNTQNQHYTQSLTHSTTQPSPHDLPAEISSTHNDRKLVALKCQYEYAFYPAHTPQSELPFGVTCQCNADTHTVFHVLEANCDKLLRANPKFTPLGESHLPLVNGEEERALSEKLAKHQKEFDKKFDKVMGGKKDDQQEYQGQRPTMTLPQTKTATHHKEVFSRLGFIPLQHEVDIYGVFDLVNQPDITYSNYVEVTKKKTNTARPPSSTTTTETYTSPTKQEQKQQIKLTQLQAKVEKKQQHIIPTHTSTVTSVNSDYGDAGGADDDDVEIVTIHRQKIDPVHTANLKYWSLRPDGSLDMNVYSKPENNHYLQNNPGVIADLDKNNPHIILSDEDVGFTKVDTLRKAKPHNSPRPSANIPDAAIRGEEGVLLDGAGNKDNDDSSDFMKPQNDEDRGQNIHIPTFSGKFAYPPQKTTPCKNDNALYRQKSNDHVQYPHHYQQQRQQQTTPRHDNPTPLVLPTAHKHDLDDLPPLTTPASASNGSIVLTNSQPHHHTESGDQQLLSTTAPYATHDPNLINGITLNLNFEHISTPSHGLQRQPTGLTSGPFSPTLSHRDPTDGSISRKEPRTRATAPDPRSPSGQGMLEMRQELSCGCLLSCSCGLNPQFSTNTSKVYYQQSADNHDNEYHMLFDRQAGRIVTPNRASPPEVAGVPQHQEPLPTRQIKVAVLLAGQDDLVPVDRIVRNFRLFYQAGFGQDIQQYKNLYRDTRKESYTEYTKTHYDYYHDNTTVTGGAFAPQSKEQEQEQKRIQKKIGQLLQTSDLHLNNVFSSNPRKEFAIQGDLLASYEHASVQRYNPNPDLENILKQHENDRLLEQHRNQMMNDLHAQSNNSSYELNHTSFDQFNLGDSAASANHQHSHTATKLNKQNYHTNLQQMIRTRVLYQPSGTHGSFLVENQSHLVDMLDWLVKD